MVYPALLPLMCTPRLPADAPAYLNGLVRVVGKMKSGFCACAITFQLASTNVWNEHSASGFRVEQLAWHDILEDV